MSNSIYLPASEKRTLAQIAREAGIPDGTLRSRLKRGASLTQAVVASPRFVGRPVVMFYAWKGKRLSLSKIAEMEGIKEATIHSRLKRGMSLQEAITSPVEFHARSYPHVCALTLATISSKSGFSIKTVRRHLHDYSLTPDEIIELGTCAIEHFLPVGQTLKSFAKKIGKSAGYTEYLLRTVGVPAEDLLHAS